MMMVNHGRACVNPIRAWEPTGAVRFGLEGEPYFVSGVDDNATHVLRTLDRSGGEGNFRYLVAM